MHATKGRCWIALAVFGFAISPTRAEWITPDSIPNPPPAVGSAAGTLVPAASWVTTQYTGLGLSFSNAAITSLNGVSVWAPLEGRGIPAHGIGPPPLPPIGYGSWQGGGVFVLPGTTNPTSVYSMTLEILGAPVTVGALNSRWQEFASVGPDGIGPHGGNLYTLSGGGIRAFSVSVPVRDSPDINYPAWGVAAVSFSNNPEPSSLVLAGLGALGLAARLGWRRACKRIA